MQLLDYWPVEVLDDYSEWHALILGLHAGLERRSALVLGTAFGSGDTRAAAEIRSNPWYASVGVGLGVAARRLGGRARDDGDDDLDRETVRQALQRVEALAVHESSADRAAAMREAGLELERELLGEDD